MVQPVEHNRHAEPARDRQYLFGVEEPVVVLDDQPPADPLRELGRH